MIGKSKRMMWAAFLFVFSAMLILAGCGGDTKSDAGLDRLKKKEEVIVTFENADGTFDPIMGWGGLGNPLMQSKLIDIGADSKLVNDLATSYKASEDGLTWTFTIREGVKFHDGKPLTAKDVAFTFNKAKESAGPVDLVNMDKAVAVDDKTVEFKMNKPFSPFLYIVATLAIVPEHAYGDTDSYNKKPIGSGPYKFVQYDQGQQLILERNDDYYGDKATFKKAVLVEMETDAAFAAVKAGKVDVAITSPALAKEKVPGYGITSLKAYDYRYISMPVAPLGMKTEEGDAMGNPVTSDLAIRKALAVGINRKQIIDVVLNGNGDPTADIFAKFPWNMQEAVGSFKDGDLEQAKKLLDEAGWVEKDGVREKDGVKAQFELMYGSSDLGRQAVAFAFAEEAKKLGIIVTPLGLDWDELEKRLKTTPAVMGGGQYNPMAIKKLLHTSYANKTGWSNPAGYSNPATDAHIEAAINAVTEEEANKHWKAALWDGENGGLVVGSVAYIPVIFVDHLYYVRDGLDIGKQMMHPHDHGLAVTSNIMSWTFK